MREGVFITVTLVVLVTSILVFFSQEFGKTGRKIFSIPGAKLFLPLILASLIVEVHEPFFYWFMLKVKRLYHNFVGYLAQEISISTAIVDGLFLFLLTMLPVVLMRIWEIRHNMPVPRPLTVQVGLFIWFVLAILLIGFES